MNIFIIETPKSNRSVPLKIALEGCEEFNVKTVSAIMITKYETIPDRYRVEFYAKYGRDPLPGEYGCLLSHRSVWEIVAQTKEASIVFEDDARDINCSMLEIFSKSFVMKKGLRAAILSFYDPRIVGRRRLFNRLGFLSLYGTSSHAVAYLLTPLAARELIESSDNFASVADWPNSSIEYFLSPWQVSHGDCASASLISSLGPRKNLKAKMGLIEILTMRHFLENKDLFGGFSNFLGLVVIPILKIKLDSLKINLVTVNLHDNRR